jgi:hypothetical protein
VCGGSQYCSRRAQRGLVHERIKFLLGGSCSVVQVHQAVNQ